MDNGASFWLGLLIAVLLVVVVAISSKVTDGRSRKTRNAVNNTLAQLVEKKVISPLNGAHLYISRDRDYKPVNELEKAILRLGFEGKKTAETKVFHTRLRKSAHILQQTIEKMDVSSLDFQSTPRHHISNSNNDDMGLILPLMILGGMDGGTSNANPSYAGDSGYSSDFSGSGGDFGGDSGGGDSGGGGDGGGGGGD
jgi:uncharacterized membrane protein YgcG